MPRREQLEEMLKTSPQDPFLNYALAMELLSEGDNHAALSQLRQVLDYDPDYVAAYFQQGQILAGEGNTDEAQQILQQGIQVAQKVGDAHAEGEMTEFLQTL